jgi:succinate dehydrogenase hydrophobic anchor subunit
VLTHITTDVAATDSAFVAARWQSGFMVAWDWLMLVSAAVHGAFGMAAMIPEYARSAGSRRRLGVALAVLTALMLVGGTATILRAAGR